MSKRRSLIGAVAFVALLGAACGGDDGGDDGGAAAGGNGGNGGSITLTAADFAWEPGSLTASAGSSIELVNEDEAKHNLTIEDAGVDEDVEGGASVTVDLGDVEAGSYEFVCEYHPDTMTGTLEVQ
ncbi:MAG TPA: cupredoxin domain-containing protein [Actinomycetota bacterium]|nr:cupredoxin domain-containing protein [Actinomycetota bacterium]